jgi:hypothetical protein
MKSDAAAVSESNKPQINADERRFNASMSVEKAAIRITAPEAPAGGRALAGGRSEESRLGGCGNGMRGLFHLEIAIHILIVRRTYEELMQPLCDISNIKRFNWTNRYWVTISQ